MSDSSLRVEIAMRSALIAKATLEMLNLEPRLVHFQLCEVVKQIKEMDDVVAEKLAR